MDFLALVKEKAKVVDIDESLVKRPVNEGFSGGEKKRNEIFQMAILDPALAILDETDSGLDIDALRVVAGGVNQLRGAGAGHDHGDALPAPAELHRARLRPRADGRAHRALRRQGAGAASWSPRVTSGWRGRWRRGERAPRPRPDVFRAHYERFDAGRSARRAGWPRCARTAMLAFRAPRASRAPREEAWRHTNVAPIARTSFALPAPGRGGPRERLRRLDFGGAFTGCGDRVRERPVRARAVVACRSRGRAHRSLADALRDEPRAAAAAPGPPGAADDATRSAA